jgi:carbamoyl-phosphate synthase large subunit
MTNNIKKIKSVLLLGSGALKIGEAGEFDYSGTQAIKALKEEGINIILVNPNVATVQTSKGLADTVYFLPVTEYFVEKIIAKEQPDGILLSFGGQTALNCGLALHQMGILEKYHVQILGTPIEAIQATEDREIFIKRLAKINLPTAKGAIVKNVSEGISAALEINYPVMVRAGFALGGSGSGIANSSTELTVILDRAFAITNQVIIEENLSGWKEIEYEVVRDSEDNCITVCNMENFDPVGIHTGESIVVAPSQTLTNREYFTLRQHAIDAIRELKIVGECNIQFALNPKTSEVRVIEVNARLSRSSALASKATGYPLAYVAAKLALGITLPEIKNKVTGVTTAFFEPALDYVVVKIPRWDLDKFKDATKIIGSEMKSVGEVMSIGRSFEEAIQKGARMLNDGYVGVIDPAYLSDSKEDLLNKLTLSDTSRLFTICSALAKGITVEEIFQITQIDRWFLEKLNNITDFANSISKIKLDQLNLITAKKLGFSDKQIADFTGSTEASIRSIRLKLNVKPFVKRIDTMAGEFPAKTNYLYFTYNADTHDYVPDADKKIAVIGCGPYAIGTSVEFDWCAVNTVNQIKKSGYKSIMINCNPETMSTDYDISDYLYFDELSLERVLDIYDLEQAPFAVSVGGQIPNNLVAKLAKNNVKMLGTVPEYIDAAEDRGKFSKLLDELNIIQPVWSKLTSTKDATEFAQKVGYPIIVRPSFVLSGRGMQVIYTETEFNAYISELDLDLKDHPLVISKYLENAKECDVDGVAQNGEIVITTISGHVENGGVHSGDSALVIPPQVLSNNVLCIINHETDKIIKALHVTGPFNVQFLIVKDDVFVIECNLRSSRSFPFVSKVTGNNLIEITTKILLGEKVEKIDLKIIPFVAVKVPQFSYFKIRGSDPVAGVEMNSTGEVVGFGRDIHEAYLSGMLSTNIKYPDKKAVFVSLGGVKSKILGLPICQKLIHAGYTLYASSGTTLFLKENNIPVTLVGKIYEGIHPNITDLMKDNLIDFAVVIPEKSSDVNFNRFQKGLSDGYRIRRMAVDLGIAVYTNIETALQFTESICTYNPDLIYIKSWQEYMKEEK